MNEIIKERRKEAIRKLSKGNDIDPSFIVQLFQTPGIFSKDLSKDKLFLAIKDFFWNFRKVAEINEENVDSYISPLLEIIQKDPGSKLSLAISNHILPYIAFECSKNVLEKWTEFDSTGESIVCMLTKQYSDASNTTENMHLPESTIRRAIERVRINAQLAGNNSLSDTLIDGMVDEIDYKSIQLINSIEPLKDKSELYKKLLAQLYYDDLEYSQNRRNNTKSAILEYISHIEDPVYLRSLIDYIYATVSAIDDKPILQEKPGKEADARVLKKFLNKLVSRIHEDTVYSIESLDAIDQMCADMYYDFFRNY